MHAVPRPRRQAHCVGFRVLRLASRGQGIDQSLSGAAARLPDETRPGRCRAAINLIAFYARITWARGQKHSHVRQTTRLQQPIHRCSAAMRWLKRPRGSDRSPSFLADFGPAIFSLPYCPTALLRYCATTLKKPRKTALLSLV